MTNDEKLKSQDFRPFISEGNYQATERSTLIKLLLKHNNLVRLSITENALV